MKIYRIQSGIVLNDQENYYLLENEDWDSFFNDDALLNKAEAKIMALKPMSGDTSRLLESQLMAPIEKQEIWASGVTYYNSKLGRQEESRDSSGGAFYAHVYEAERPELFYKGNVFRTAKPGGMVRIRQDSTWNVPEPELTLAITSSGKIIGYTIGNDMSSRSIEGENPLYLPQAKTYDGSAGLGPCIYVTDEPLDKTTRIRLVIYRGESVIFEGETRLSEMKRSPEELASFLYRECSFQYGCFLMTGTGIVPGKDFTLNKGDEIHISIDSIGTLINIVN